MDDEAIALFKKHGAWYVPTISAGRYVADKAKDRRLLFGAGAPEGGRDRPADPGDLRRAYRAGVKIAFGTDAGVFPHGDNAREFAYMVEAGMPPLEAIRSATLGAADLLDQSGKPRLGRTGLRRRHRRRQRRSAARHRDAAAREVRHEGRRRLQKA